jgi:hypothetical protein
MAEDSRMLALSNGNAPLRIMWETGKNTTLPLEALEAMVKDNRSWINFQIMALGGPPALMTAKVGENVTRFRVTFTDRVSMAAKFDSAF